ncbi:MAG: efflux RND transporter permease subunit [Deltaproteobacteria bacterium]|nr:efflux RND transporter permease subunit [Candidatus Zymogenaceae bacterium]
MSIAKFSVKNPVLVNMITIGVVIFGIISTMSLNREVFPSISYGYIVIVTAYPGASPEEVEKVVTTPFEEEIADVDGIKKLESVTREGVSTIIIQAESDVEGLRLDQLLNDLRNEVDKVTDLPADVDDPEFLKISAEFPVVTVAISGDVPEETLRATSERLKSRIELVKDVGTVDRFGYRDREMWVSVDPRRLEAANLTLSEVILAIKKRNLNIPGGTIDQNRKEILIRTIGEVEDTGDLGDVIVRSLPAGPVRVRDIAEVTETYKKRDVYGRVDGKPSIALLVTKKAEGDAIDIVEEIQRIVDEERALVPKGTEITLVQDFAKYVQRRQNTLLTNGLMGLVLVIIVLVAMLETWIAVWAALSIPFSFLTSMIVMHYMGISLNMLSMFGLILVIGMVVDNAIVVSENFFRYRELGLSTKEAAIAGTGEVALPVAAALSTNIAAFLPLLLTTGILGKFMRVIPEVAIICFLASWFQAFFILPCNLNQFVKVKVDTTKKEFRGWFKDFRDYYGRILEFCIRRRYIIFSGLISIAAATIIFALITMEFVWMGKMRAEQFMVTVNNPVDANLAETDRVMKEVEKYVMEIPSDELASVVTTVGTAQGETGYQYGTYLGQVNVELTEFGYTERDSEETINTIREKVGRIAGPTSIAIEMIEGGPPTGKPVSVEIKGNDFAVLEKLAGEVVEELKTTKGVKDIDTNYRRGKDEIKIIIDEHKVRTLGLDVATIATEVRNAFAGGDAGNIRRGDEKIDIVVKYHDHFSNPNYLMNFSVTNMKGERVPIKSVSDIIYGKGIFKIYHSERKRTITVTADILRGETTSATVNKALMKRFGTASEEHPGYLYDYTGEFRDTQESMDSMISAFWLALGIIFIIMAALFRSFLQPIVIMVAIPFAFIGVVFGLFIMGEQLSILAVIGVVALMGIVVNNSILLLDFINRARENGSSIHDAVVESGKTRLRPIMLTSMTTLGGLFPMAFGIGGSEPYLAPMAISMFWGMLFSTMLTLFAVPALYIITEDFKARLGKMFGGAQ